MKAARLAYEDLSDAWIARLNQSSLMASTPFARLWETVGGTAVFWAVEDAGQIVAVLSGVEFRSRPITRLQVMPDGLFAHPVCMSDSREYRQRVSATLLSGLHSAGYAKLFLTDYFDEFAPMEAFEAAECLTTVVPVSPDWQPPDAKLRSEIRKAEREGVTAQSFDSSSHMDGFFRLVRETEARHGRKPKYPETFFVKLAALAAQDDRIKWLYVERDGRPAVSHIYFVERDTLLNWQIYFDKQFSFLKANQYLLYTMARQCAGLGITKVNLGMTPEDAEGVRAYKEKWGGETYRYRQLSARSVFGRLI